MIAGNQGHASTLRELCRFAQAIEKRGNDLFTQPELAKELGIGQATVGRYLVLFASLFGLKHQQIPGKGCRVKGSWKFIDAMRRYYQNL